MPASRSPQPKGTKLLPTPTPCCHTRLLVWLAGTYVCPCGETKIVATPTKPKRKR